MSQRGIVLNSIRLGIAQDAFLSTHVSNVRSPTGPSTVIFLPLVGKSFISPGGQVSHPSNPALPSPSPLRLPTPVDSDRLLLFLSGYAPTVVDFLVKGFREGFPVPSEGSRFSCDSPNLKSALQNAAAVDAKLCKELESHRLAGPFSPPPPLFLFFVFPNLVW